MPAPSRLDDLVKRSKLRFPAQFIDGLLCAGDQSWGIARTARFLDGGNRLAADALAGLDDLPHGVALAVAEIVISVFARLHREHVRLREVDDVYVIADAGAVQGRVVGAEDFAFLRLPQRNLEDVGNQVCLNAVMFAELFAGPGGIEITQCDKFQSVQFLIPTQQFFENELTFTVGVDRVLRQRLGHGHRLRHAEGGAGGAEHELPHASLDGGLEEVYAIGHVVAEILGGIRHRLADECVGSEVHDGLRLV